MSMCGHFYENHVVISMKVM